MRALTQREGVGDRITIDSAGTGAYHVGEQPDPRTVAAAARRGITLEHAAWQFTAKDLARFDLVIAMDSANLRILRALRGAQAAPALHLFRSFDPSAPAGAEVADPWYGGDAGFEAVLDQCERAAAGLLAHVRTLR